MIGLPIWKKWLSYLMEIPIEQSGSDLNPDLQLGLKKGRLCLSTPNAIYSYDDLYDNFSKSFKQLNIAGLPIENVLVLGFGLGSIPYMLEKVFHRKYNYVGVEADELVAYWSSKYMVPKLDSPVQMIVADALTFVETSEEQFDLIAMDVFVDNEIPEEFETEEFLEMLQSMLTEKGVLMYNLLSLRPEDKIRTEDFYKNQFKKVFPAASYIDLKGNWMLVNRPLP